MPTPPDETGDAQTGDVAMGTNTDPPAKETELGAGKNEDEDPSANSNHSVTEERVTEPVIKIDVPTVSVTVQINDPKDQTTSDGQAASNAAEAEDQVAELPSAVQRRVKGGGSADENKRRSLMLWVDADLVQTVRPDQGTKSPQHSPEDIPSDLKRLKKVIRKERWASDTEHEVRKEMWKTLCLKNSSGASVSHVYHEVEEGLFGKETDSVDPSSITLPSFVDPDHPASSYALKSEGQARLNRLLCVLADTRPDILFCPLLAPLAGMLLHYMSPEETFDGLSALLGSTRYKFLEVSWVEHESFRISFEKLAARFAASAHKMFIKQGNVAEIYQDWIWWILEDLPFSHVIRVMDCYLSEGLKIFYRVGLAILMLYKKHKGTAEAPDGVAASIREFVRSIPVSPNTLLTVGFQFRGLSRSVIGTFQTKHKETLREDNSPYRAASRRQNSVITKLNQINSSIITHQQLHTIWSWVPTRFSIYQPSLVFTTQEHGFSLTTFYTRCEYCEPTILLIKTSDQEIFGAFLSSSWSTRNDGDHKGIYFGTGESFLFSFAPEEKKYPWVGILPKEEAKEEEKEKKEEEKKEEEKKEEEEGEKKEDGGVEGEDGERRASGASGGSLKKKMNEMFMRASPSLVAVGGGDGDGILIEGDLTKGFSTHCLTFENPGLAKERSFNCDVIEVITMEDGRNPLNGVTA